MRGNPVVGAIFTGLPRASAFGANKTYFVCQDNSRLKPCVGRSQ
jgi:hypothetical protein